MKGARKRRQREHRFLVWLLFCFYAAQVSDVHADSYPRRGTRGGMDGWNPSPESLMCCSISKRFYLQWKAFDLLNKMRYILRVVALLEAFDLTNKWSLSCRVNWYFDFAIIQWSLITAMCFPLCSLRATIPPVRVLVNAFPRTRKMDISVSAWKDSPEKTAKRVRITISWNNVASN